jgi:hypothetical protein
LDAASKAGQIVEISLDQPQKSAVRHARAAKAKLLLAQNGSGKVSVISVLSDKANVRASDWKIRAQSSRSADRI